MVRFNSKKFKEFIDSKEGERNHTTSRLFKALFGSKKLNLFRLRLGSNMCYVLFSFNILGKMIQFDPYFSYVFIWVETNHQLPECMGHKKW